MPVTVIVTFMWVYERVCVYILCLLISVSADVEVKVAARERIELNYTAKCMLFANA